jgi:acetyltransferase-like isoleucine patch superfamily enzyme
VIIQTSRAFSNVNIILHDESHFEIHQRSHLPQLFVFLRDGSRLIIGENTLSIGQINLYSHERASIRIGRDCLLGGDLRCLASDMHSIVDVETGDRVNPPANIVVGDRVWTGFDVTLLKGTNIGAGSVVGARSTVSGNFPENSLLLGYPARVARSGVTWNADLLPNFVPASS